MRKYSIYFICFIVVFLVAEHVSAQQPTAIEVTKRATVYDNRTGELVKVGELVEGQQFQVQHYGTNWWRIHWGTYDGYVSKSQTKVIQQVTYKNGTKRVTSGSTIKMVNNTAVYDNTSGSLVQFATIYANQVYPVASKAGNWYGVEVNGRLGFIHESRLASPPAPAPQPVEKPNGKRYIEALQETAIFDLRDAAYPYQIATLAKGQQLEVVAAETEKYYQIYWGKAYAYVDKATVRLVNKAYTNVADDRKVKNQYFIAASNTAIYDNTGGKLVAMATLQKNMRYPILEQQGAWLVTTIGSRKGYIHTSKVKMDKGIPVMMYHHILKPNELGVYKNVSTTITTNQFEEQMQYLAGLRYRTISVADLERYMKGDITLPANSILLTFDDGILTTKVYAYEVLKRHKFKATQYMITYRNEYAPANQAFDPYKLQFLSFADMQQMSDVYSYESHTYDLHHFVNNQSKVLTVSRAELVADLQKNLAQLPNATSFAYPFGKYNKQTMDVLKSLGYRTAMTTIEGFNMPYDDVYQIKRFGPTQKTTLEHFKKMVIPYN